MFSEVQNKLFSVTDEFSKVSEELEQYKDRQLKSEHDQNESTTHLDQLKTAINEKTNEIGLLRDEMEALKKHLHEASQDNTLMTEK